MEIVSSVVSRIGESLVTPIGLHFGYLIHYKSKIENFSKQLDMLESQRIGWQESIDAAIRNGEEIRSDVKDWTARVDEFKVEAIKFLQDAVKLNKRCSNRWFPDLITRYQIGKKAQKKTKVVTDLQIKGCNFNNMPISNPAAPSGILVPMSSTNFLSYQTTELAMKEVMEALKEENINFIGLHGMGGVGKTTLAKEIGRKAKEEKLFDEVVMVVVSQNFDLKKIEDQIADMLGLTFTEQSDIGRAGRLYARLKGVNKILIILDDVWTRFEVADVGIPLGDDHKGCKVIVTTRREQVCDTMGTGRQTTKIVYLDIFSEEDSWDLLRRNAGDAIESSPQLKVVAKQIADECRGLPVAIVTVGRALRDKDLQEWKEAVQELKKSLPSNMEGVDEHVYRCLKLSYDYLRDEEAKSCFLLCSLFPEDDDILIETLVRYAVGLEIFKHVDSIQDARRRARSVINNLRAACLLMASDDGEDCIKMHDVVRDVAISIGFGKYLVRAGVNLKEWPKKEILDHHTGISLMDNEITEVGNVSERLEIMLLQGNERLDWGSINSFFERLKALRVLDLSQTRNKSRRIDLPPSFGCLNGSLQTLVLERMEIGDTSALGEIKTLEVLSFKGCKFHKSPVGIRELTNLRLLDMSWCEYDKDGIPEGRILEANMISSLSLLEELYLLATIWHFGNELNSLPRLTALTIYIANEFLDSVGEDFVFPDLEAFLIRSHRCGSPFPNHLELRDTTGCRRRSVRLWLNCFKRLLKTTISLYLEDISITNIVPSLSDDGGEGCLNLLETLAIWGCDKFEYLIDNREEEEEECGGILSNNDMLSNLKSLYLRFLPSFKGICSNGDVLPSTVSLLSKLQQLELQYLPRLTHIWNCPPTSQLVLHLHNLRLVKIQECDGLKNIFYPSIARSLHQLEEIEVANCKELEEIVAKKNEEQDEEEEPLVDKTIVFSSLRKLKLLGLSNLNGFCMGSFPFEWPALEELIVEDCPMMKTFAAAAAATSFEVSQVTPKLKAIKLNSVEIVLEGVDLNTVLQNHFETKETPITSSTATESEK